MDREQTKKLADHFAEIPNQYEQLKFEEIKIPDIHPNEITQFKSIEVWWMLTQLKTNKSTIQGDISVKVYKELAAYICEPLTHVYNSSLLQGQYPSIYKYEISKPVPKKHPVEIMDQMRNISGLLKADKNLEKLLLEMIIADMKSTAKQTQFGNQKNTSIQHYLIKMIHRILTVVDNNARREVGAVVTKMIDWNWALIRQCP